jgi:hypothetical protein
MQKASTEMLSQKSAVQWLEFNFEFIIMCVLMPFLGALKLHKTNAITVNYSHRRPSARSGNNFYRCRQQCFRPAWEASPPPQNVMNRFVRRQVALVALIKVYRCVSSSDPRDAAAMIANSQSFFMLIVLKLSARYF